MGGLVGGPRLHGLGEKLVTGPAGCRITGLFIPRHFGRPELSAPELHTSPRLVHRVTHTVLRNPNGRWEQGSRPYTGSQDDLWGKKQAEN